VENDDLRDRVDGAREILQEPEEEKEVESGEPD